ncbi:hypothetical protein DERF_003993 [Dermatophagoides farinae]|uniref:Uncharacterized protein n=1 Tax=Dermatophagoides farinae TaxID=6954 RepID=A0A922LBY3_DERFA|nr:hypothetical protein DERF_003993 [Dermatophagoides farinae]
MYCTKGGIHNSNYQVHLHRLFHHIKYIYIVCSIISNTLIPSSLPPSATKYSKQINHGIINPNIEPA